MSDTEKLIDLIKNKSKLVAMLAPSFPIMYESEEIIPKLRSIGFDKIVEVSLGAKETNKQLVALINKHPKARFITSPCASFTRFIKTKYREFIPYLAEEVDSPMIATAKIVKEKFPGYQIVFIGPCIVKKLEAKEEHPELDILVLTYKELDSVFSLLPPITYPLHPNKLFDLFETSTRLYPTDGGLTNSSGVLNILKEDEVMIVSGYKNCEKALTEFQNNPKIKLLDILFCEGGCINGPGIVTHLSKEERIKKVIVHAQKTA